MISKPTVLVLGAGASVPYGFPTGPELKSKTVAELMDATSGTHQRLRESGFSQTEQKMFALALAGSARNSIDAFLEGRSEYRRIGTAAIAAALIPCENWFIFHRVDNTEDWYAYTWNTLGNRRSEIPSNVLKILTFNYDRSLEYFLVSAAKDSWGMTWEAAAEFIGATFEIIHLHGQLGALPGLAENDTFERGTPAKLNRTR